MLMNFFRCCGRRRQPSLLKFDGLCLALGLGVDVGFQ